MTRIIATVSVLALLAACDAQAPVQNNDAATANTAEANSADTVAVDSETAKRLMKERHEGMEAIGKANKAVSQALKSSAPDVAVIQASAAKINELAQKSGDWFPAGTGPDVGKTRAKAEIWQKPEDFAAKDRNFQQAAQAFDAAAKSGDLDRIKASFGELGKTCKACHDDYRAPEKDH